MSPALLDTIWHLSAVQPSTATQNSSYVFTTWGQKHQRSAAIVYHRLSSDQGTIGSFSRFSCFIFLSPALHCIPYSRSEVLLLPRSFVLKHTDVPLSSWFWYEDNIKLTCFLLCLHMYTTCVAADATVLDWSTSAHSCLLQSSPRTLFCWDIACIRKGSASDFVIKTLRGEVEMCSSDTCVRWWTLLAS